MTDNYTIIVIPGTKTIKKLYLYTSNKLYRIQYTKKWDCYPQMFFAWCCANNADTLLIFFSLSFIYWNKNLSVRKQSKKKSSV